MPFRFPVLPGSCSFLFPAATSAVVDPLGVLTGFNVQSVTTGTFNYPPPAFTIIPYYRVAA